VGRVRWLYNAAKAGHTGTLDPLATGILPIALGEATKTVPFVVDGSKTYRFTVRFGAETDTDDTQGKVLETSDRRPTLSEIEAALPRFTGEISQIPPRYSAIKVEGARAYDLARDDEDFVLEPRIVNVDRLDVVDQPDADHCVLEADCGKGTYVRALARDLGRALQCLGHVSALRRTKVGAFTEDRAVPLSVLEECADESRETLMARLLPVEVGLEDLPSLTMSSADAGQLRQGRAVLLRGRDAPLVTGPVYAVSKGELVALGEVEEGEFRPRRIFNLSS
jgi:tRNA pseudouridine55 synthase